MWFAHNGAVAVATQVRCPRIWCGCDLFLPTLVNAMQILGVTLVCLAFTTTHGLMTLYEPDYDALMDVYIFANGAEWIDRTNWKRGDPCDPAYPWFGVTCMYDTLYQRYRVSEVGNSLLRCCLSRWFETCVAHRSDWVQTTYVDI